MRSSLPVMLAVGPGIGQAVMVVILVVYPILNWIYKTVKGDSGKPGPQRKPGAGTGSQQSAQARQEELRRLSQQQANQFKSPTINPVTKQEKTARELARDLYRQRADALRAQMASPPAGQPEAMRSNRAMPPNLVSQVVSPGAQQSAILKARAEAAKYMRPAPAMKPNVVLPGVPMPSAERKNRMSPPRAVRPAAPVNQPPRQPMRPKASAPTAAPATNAYARTPLKDGSGTGKAPAQSPAPVAESTPTNRATIRGFRGRPAIILMRDSLREAMILREVLDRPLAMRDPVMPI